MAQRALAEESRAIAYDLSPSSQSGLATEHKCTVSSVCGAPDWIANTEAGVDACPQPEISGVEPRSGPVEGGTAVIVTGSNFGRETADILSVTLGGLTCDNHVLDVAKGQLSCSSSAGVLAPPPLSTLSLFPLSSCLSSLQAWRGSLDPFGGAHAVVCSGPVSSPP